MKVKIRLQQHGLHRHNYWWIVVQPLRKNPKGKFLEKLGIWAPHKKKTVPRQVAINKHRARYWLSVGAEPTNRVHRLLHKFGMLPKLPSVWGSAHEYERPEKTYQVT